MAISDVLQSNQHVAVSTTIKMLINGNFVGAIQSLSPSQTRNTVPVRGIGIGDRQLERVWGLSEYTLSVQKMAFFKQFMFEALGYAATFRMIAELRAPIDIQEQIVMPDKSAPRITFYRGCYLKDYSAPREITGDLIVMETANFDVTSIDDNNFLPFASGGDYPTGLV